MALLATSVLFALWIARVPRIGVASSPRLKKLNADDMSGCVVVHDELVKSFSAGGGLPSVIETPLIGKASTAESLGAGQMSWPHGFNLRHLAFKPGVETERHARHEEEVIFVHSGVLTVTLPGGELNIVPGDTLTVPIGMQRSFSNHGDDVVEAYVVRGGWKNCVACQWVPSGCRLERCSVRRRAK